MGHEAFLSGRSPAAPTVPQLATLCYNHSTTNNNTPSIIGNNAARAQQLKGRILSTQQSLQQMRKNELEEATKKMWRSADAVCFDVDSTVCQDEAIDELAHHLGKGEEVALCTQRAMGGNMTFREALSLRLDLMRPTQQQLHHYVRTHPIKLTPGIVELVAELRRKGVDVYLVSGGFRSIIHPVAERLNIDPHERVYANRILFDENGTYAGFDEDELTSNSGSEEVGKAGVCGLLKAKKGYKTLIMVGDGATDAEACPPADAFIGFGGNQIREAVKKLSDWYVNDFETLIAELLKDSNKEEAIETKV